MEKALFRGEFPDKKWKRGSVAERIVHVAVHEKASEDTIRAYARLEISAMERGMFLLEVIVAGAPLIGLLGTVTGLVEVFSNMPAGGMVDKTLFLRRYISGITHYYGWTGYRIAHSTFQLIPATCAGQKSGIPRLVDLPLN